MLWMHALTMIGQDFYHPAIRHMTVAATFHHQFQFGLQGCQAPDSLFNLRQSGLRNGISGAAGLVRVVLQRQKSPDRLDLKSQLSGMSNEGQPA